MCEISGQCFLKPWLLYTGFYCIKNVQRSNAVELPMFIIITISLYDYFVENPLFDFVWTYYNRFCEVPYLDLSQESTGMN